MNTNLLPNVKCGEIYYVDIPESSGCVQYGYRPCLIVSNDINNWYSNTVNVIPITSRKKVSPVHVTLDKWNEYGLKRPSLLLVEQMMPVPLECVEGYIGKIDDGETLLKVAEAMGVQFPMLGLVMAAQKEAVS